MNDLVKELKELEKLSSVSFILQKLNEVYEKVGKRCSIFFITRINNITSLFQVYWLYEKFEIGSKLKYIITFFHLKIHEITQTALTAENKYV